MSKQKVLGFAIHNKGNSLYAVRRINERLYWIALGESIEGAEKKIISYCDNHQLDLNKKARITKAVLTEKVNQLEKMVLNLTDRVRQLEVRQDQTKLVRKLEGKAKTKKSKRKV